MQPDEIHKTVFGQWDVVALEGFRTGEDYVTISTSIEYYCYRIKGDFSSVYPTATLRVPKGTKAQYEATPEWNRFAHIVEMDDTGIGSPSMVNGQCSMFHDLQGRRLTQEPQQGVFIRNGRKVVKGN